MPPYFLPANADGRQNPAPSCLLDIYVTNYTNSY